MNPVYGRKSDLQDELEAQRVPAFFRPYFLADLKRPHDFSHFHSNSQRERSKEKSYYYWWSIYPLGSTMIIQGVQDHLMHVSRPAGAHH